MSPSERGTFKTFKIRRFTFLFAIELDLCLNRFFNHFQIHCSILVFVMNFSKSCSEFRCNWRILSFILFVKLFRVPQLYNILSIITRSYIYSEQVVNSFGRSGDSVAFFQTKYDLMLIYLYISREQTQSEGNLSNYMIHCRFYSHISTIM